MAHQSISPSAALVLSLPLMAAPAVLAQEKNQDDQALDQAANDPTASLMNIQIQNIYTDSYYNLDDESGNTILLRSAVPFSTGPLDHIARATFPIITDSPAGESGVGDLVLFDLLVFNRSWGRWGFGPVALLPTASEDVLGAEKWALGPAVGFVALSRQLLWGVFNQNLFTVDGDKDRKDVNISNIQPIISYSLPRQWSIGTSEMNVVYDWEEDDWTAIPLGLKLAKLTTFSGMPVQFSGAYEYNFKDDYITPEWTVNFTVKFLFPVH